MPRKRLKNTTMKKSEWTGYVSKSGKNRLYKIAARFTTKEGVKRVKLKAKGSKGDFEFWVNESDLCRPPKPIRRENEQTKTCWECGCLFTWRESIYYDGEWSDSYCGC